MIVYDDIVSSINGTGGIGVLFSELKHYLSKNNEPFKEIFAEGLVAPRVLERYRDCNYRLKEQDLFHSTYYRLPHKRYRNMATTITTVHDFTYERVIGGLKAAVHTAQKQRAILGSDKIICVSENTRKDLLHFMPSIPQDKIYVVPNGVSEKFKVVECSSIDISKVLYVGSRASYKNFTSLVQALSCDKNFRLECVGGGAFSKRERNYLEKFLPGRFKHLGRLTTEELNLHYNQAYALVYPSLYEGFGIPVLEAFKAGCPVIAVDCSSIPEIAGKAALLMKRGKPKEILSCLQELKENSHVRDELIAAGLERAKHFSWEKTSLETLKVYKE